MSHSGGRSAPYLLTATGTGGTEIWKFVPTKAGEETLRLAYRRLWETDAAPARVVTYKVTVSEPKKR